MLWMLWLSWRELTSESSKLDDRLSRGEQLIGCFWHGDYFPLFVLLRHRDAYVVSSASFRGLVISRICQHFGFRTALIPERGEEAYRQMKRVLEEAQLIAVALDGPLGPYHLPKRGVVTLSFDLAVPLLPISVAASRAWVAEKRWDRRCIPKPFSRVALAVGEPIALNGEPTDESIRRWQDRLRQEMEATDRRARAILV